MKRSVQMLLIGFTAQCSMLRRGIRNANPFGQAARFAMPTHERLDVRVLTVTTCARFDAELAQIDVLISLAQTSSAG